MASGVENAWAAYSGTIAAPHEYFDQTGFVKLALRFFSVHIPQFRQRIDDRVIEARSSDRTDRRHIEG